MIFGEALFDVFPGGQSVLGGAPFNVAWNLKGFGFDPLFISRVGSDDRGAEVIRSMLEWGMDVTGVQTDPDHPTGVVEVSIEDDQPSFSILPDQAYDFIDPESAMAAVREGDFSVLYHGTLIARSQRSRSALNVVRETLTTPVFVDVNLRPPWWDGDIVRDALSGADWAKLNDQELFEILGSCLFSGADMDAAADYFRSEHGLYALVVTLGGAGSLLATRRGVIRSKPVMVNDLVDTVGAGDAFSAVAIAGLVLGWPFEVILDRATDFASEICRVRGATTSDIEIYAKHARGWRV